MPTRRTRRWRSVVRSCRDSKRSGEHPTPRVVRRSSRPAHRRPESPARLLSARRSTVPSSCSARRNGTHQLAGGDRGQTAPRGCLPARFSQVPRGASRPCEAPPMQPCDRSHHPLMPGSTPPVPSRSRDVDRCRRPRSRSHCHTTRRRGVGPFGRRLARNGQRIPFDVRSPAGDRECDLVGAGQGALLLHAPERHQSRRDPGQPWLHDWWRHSRQLGQRRSQQLGRCDRPEPHRPVDDRPLPCDRGAPSQSPYQRVRSVRRERHADPVALRRDAGRHPRHRLECPAPVHAHRLSRERRHGAAPQLHHRIPQPTRHVRLDRERWPTAHRHDAERRNRRRRDVDRSRRTDRDVHAARGQRLRRHGSVDSRRRQRCRRDAPPGARRRRVYGDRRQQRRQRDLVVHRRSRRAVVGRHHTGADRHVGRRWRGALRARCSVPAGRQSRSKGNNPTACRTASPRSACRMPMSAQSAQTSSS